MTLEELKLGTSVWHFAYNPMTPIQDKVTTIEITSAGTAVRTYNGYRLDTHACYPTEEAAWEKRAADLRGQSLKLFNESTEILRRQLTKAEAAAPVSKAA